MEIKIFHALWGMEGSIESLLERAAAEGFDGIEAPIPSPEHKRHFQEQLDKHRLSYIAQVVTAGNHIDSFTDQVERAVDLKPLLIVSHSAKDNMPFADQVRFFEQSIAVEKSVGIPVGHETHRSRAMFTPWTTAALLRELPDLRITADFSHWCCVTESMLETYSDDLSLALKRTIHIHARIGHAQGPQVSHPGAPEYAREREAFKTWWAEVIKERARDGAGFTTFTPEFGPPGYMPTLPFSRQSLSDLRGVNTWMTNWIRDTYIHR
ncbi:sugar phosphate isomerase/epimerase [Paenibacillus sp. XY044]|uniref:sugar phosphate isomerase/epimerase family protein n=1 Tax=Paenibacillus sp. XY044 TaxID=2026089 RepID=UPI000B99A64C|nr:xylose isomerase [Paenibacillus sp. XY044]OZB92332.1 xylose isomerase [Paenibacillus sp. XY044]